MFTTGMTVDGSNKAARHNSKSRHELVCKDGMDIAKELEFCFMYDAYGAYTAIVALSTRLQDRAFECAT